MSYARRTTLGPRGRSLVTRVRARGSLSGTSLGDAASDQDWQTQVLSTLQYQNVIENQRRQEENRQRWIQIAVTASIPLFGAVWRVILGRRRSRMY